jgi:prepilin-type N-terminal cleavage/methylation domain-containing protein
MNKRHAFTLIEMLVVIAIIGIVAALVVNMNSGAQTAKRNAQVNGDKASLTLMIDNYHSKLNFYPPDNGSLISNTTPFAIYDAYAATNPLLYELTGATNNPPNNPGMIQLFDGTNVPQLTFEQTYGGRSAIANAVTDPTEQPPNFFQPGPQPKEYTNYNAGSPLKGLLVPVPIVANSPINFWHYDASSANRHNLSSYDLWAEYITGSKNGSNIITTNGNW